MDIYRYCCKLDKKIIAISDRLSSVVKQSQTNLQGWRYIE